MSEEAERFGELRELLHQASSKNWSALLELYGEAGIAPQTLDYVEGLLQSWPQTIRRLPAAWVDACLSGAREQLPMSALWARSLRFPRPTLNDALLARLVSMDHIAGIERLDLSYGKVSVEGITALANAPTMRQLRSLNLLSNPIGDIGLEALLRGESMRNLQALILAGCELGPESCWVLADSPRLAQLESLNLAFNPLGDDGIRQLVRSPGCAQLTSLDVSACGLSEAGMQAVADSEHLRGLTWLDIRENDLGDRGRQALASSAYLCEDIRRQWGGS